MFIVVDERSLVLPSFISFRKTSTKNLHQHGLVVYQIAPEFVITSNKYTIKKLSFLFPPLRSLARFLFLL